MFGPEGRPHHCCAWLGIASSFPECASAIITEELNKIGRDAISYVESLIESIMGGLEGLINILDSEGGFGALEMQLNPEQAALRMNAIKVSSHSAKSPKGFLCLQLPGHESRPESINSVKMLEAAMQRLTSLCSVLNDMEPVCVLNHVFVLREYMRDCILGNFRRRLLTVLRTDSSLQRPSIVESLLCRHIRIIHIVEQHLSMDLSEGVRQVLLSETFSASILDPHTSLQSGSAIEMISSWYMDIIVKDSNSAGVTFAPSRSCFKSLKLVGEYSADAYTDAKELKSLIRMFGGYGFDRLDRLAREHVAALLSCIDTGLQENREALEAMAGSLSSGDPVKREENLRHVLDLETLVGFCIQAGQAIAFWRLLADATGAVLEEHAPLIFSLFSGASKHLPDNEIPEKDEISRLRKVASSIGAGNDVDWIHSIMKECGAACDSSWSLLPYLCASFMASNMWGAAIFDACTGGFSNNMHCLARCINAVIGGSELVRMERKEQQWRSESRSGGHPHEYLETDLRRSSAEASIKSAVQVFVKCSVTIILEPWNQTPSSSRSHLAPKLIFLDQLCCLSPYLPRSTLEAHVPYAILRSAYSERYGSSRPALPPLELLLRHPRQSPLILLNRGDSTLVSATAQGEVNTGRSGPLDYGSNRKARFGSSTGADQGSSPLAMFMASRSGPLRYK